MTAGEMRKLLAMAEDAMYRAKTDLPPSDKSELTHYYVEEQLKKALDYVARAHRGACENSFRPGLHK